MSEEVPGRKPITKRATGTDTVCVACSLPQGLWLDLYNIEVVESVLPNGRVIKENIASPNLEHGRWFVRGVVDRNALITAAAGGSDDFLPDDYRVVRGTAPGTGYALTHGIPRDYWEEWARVNHDSPLIKQKIIFCASSENRAMLMAKEYKDFKSGLQGLNPAGDYRISQRGSRIRKFDRNDNTADAAPEEAEAGV